MSAKSSKIDEHLNSLCLPSLPSQVFHKPTVFNGFNHVSVYDVQCIIAKMPAKTSSLIVFLSHLLNRVAICLVICCQILLTVIYEGIFPGQFKLGQVELN